MSINCPLDIPSNLWNNRYMKSAREKALTPKSPSKPGKIDLGPEANKILKNLERARNYGAKRKYNSELKRLVRDYPEFEESILALRLK